MSNNRVYLAARYSRHPAMREVRRDLLGMGYVVTSRWIDGDHQVPHGQEQDNPDLAAEIARHDLEDLDAADLVISFQERPSELATGRGGRHFELGYAVARGKRVLCVGPLEHAFTALPQIVRFEDWPTAMRELAMWTVVP